MEIDREIVESLTYRGVLAYVAVMALGDGLWSTAQLAQMVSCNASLMLEGMHELNGHHPGIVAKPNKKKWPVTTGKPEASADGVQILDYKTARRTALLDDIKKIFEWANKTQFTMNGFDGVAVGKFLKQHKDMTQEQWRTALKHRFTSEVSKGQPVHVWLPRLSEYMEAPLDRFGKPMLNGGGKHGEIATSRQRNREAIERAISNA